MSWDNVRAAPTYAAPLLVGQRALKIAFLAGADSSHTVRWANAMVSRGHHVELLTAHNLAPHFPLDPAIPVHRLPFKPPAGYFLNVREARRLLRSIRPDVVHVQYASGYGTLGRLTGVQPSVLSIWGSDVTEFPKGCVVKRWILRRNLRFPRLLCATSEYLKRETEKILKSPRPIFVTPFGVDCTQFRPDPARRDLGTFVVGTVKTLEPGYGIDRLIHAFALFNRMIPATSRRVLRIVGDGSLRESLEAQVRSLGITDITEFIGRVRSSDVPTVLNSFSVYVALSRVESFGVAVLEASAAGVPVIVSDVGGLPEIVVDGSTGIIVPGGSPSGAAEAMMRLYSNHDEGPRMGAAAREFVYRNYSIERTTPLVEELYYRAAAT